MKKIRWMAILTLAALVLPAPALARGRVCGAACCGEGRQGEQAGRGGPAGPGRSGTSRCAVLETIAELPAEAIDDEERSDLIYMREEEKLARDVYRALDGLWGPRPFGHIAAAEQRHMDVLLELLDKYDISDPVGDNPPGVFRDAELQTLYDDLLEQGTVSLDDALTVGATLEDLDIRDLQQSLARADNADIGTAFRNLQKASRNHMRAFVSVLEAGGSSYEAQYISPEELQAILDSPRERGPLDADGEPIARAGCGNGGPRRHGRR